ncbi:PRELI domain containing 1a isoform X2 [Lampris incognitus]|uniref:PRELI domain containing 1a isoform X2 n=1 Tax=Lampris incognitus TaxID=2546036 RepID=UPI0024B4EEB9|nr:PRELI domain containing 1a isoform X2 [Lampris incognitus]
MVKYFCCAGFIKSSWDQVCVAFWQRYPNPYRRLLTKTSRAPRWMERYLPKHMASSAYIIEDSVVDPQARTMTTLTWNISHARLMSVEERCEYRINNDNGSWTEIKREAWISSNVYGLSRAIQEFGLARFKTGVTKTMKGFEYVLAKMQGETPSRTLAETATERARETALAAKEKAKDLASQAQKKQYV